jgi:glycerophosphoryl diester phosphodiesterase
VTQESRARPLVFAHRGSSASLPEHTLDAYLRAIEEGADGLECDVRLTNDGHLVCLHDRRLERTSTGRGLVSEHSLAELQALDFGRADPPAAGAEAIVERQPGGYRILTLDRLLEVVRDAPRPVRLLVETKHPTRFGAQVEQRQDALLRRYGLDRPSGQGHRADGREVTVMSFSAAAVRRVRLLAPEVPTVLLLDVLPPWVRDGRLPPGVRVAGPGIRLVRSRPALVERLHRRGNRVYVWTVNTDEDIDLVRRLGVAGIISDRPGHVLDRLDGSH